MFKRIFLGVMVLFLTTLSISMVGFAQEDQIVQIAIETAKVQMRIPRGIEVKFIEKRKSPLPGFYSVKLIIMAPDREIPTPIPPCIMESLAVKDPILRLLSLLKLMKNLLYLLRGKMPHLKSYLL